MAFSALYAHIFNTRLWEDPDHPELFGFLKNQVSAFPIPNKANNFLYAWHVLPTALYKEYEEYVLDNPADTKTAWQTTRLSFDPVETLLRNRRDARLVISFHGNAGTVSQGWRPDAYRNFASADPKHIHVWAIDYRGFGYSSGTPSEAGLIEDGIAAVDYALDVVGLSPEQIVIVGQSLGTGVSLGVAEHFRLERGIEFAGIVLVAPFTTIPELLLDYSIAGLVPVLSPLRAWPKLQAFFASKMTETWDSARRLAILMKHCKRLKLYTIHAKDDWDIPWRHSEKLFHIAANASTKTGFSSSQIDGVKMGRKTGRNQWYNIWKAATGDQSINFIRQDIVPTGGHNRVTTFPVVARAIHQAFENSR